MCKMSDSDSDGLLTNNVFTFQNESTTVSAKGPNTNMTNITGISFRNNVFSSTMRMPQPYERQRYAESSYDQRSISNRRAVSPMSVRSACDMRQRNFNYSFNPQGMGAPRSVLNGRSGSPMSMRSMGTSASTTVSAVDIVHAIKNEQFNKYELKVIKEACNKYVRYRIRKKMDNRRYRKIRRRTSGYDSGEQGSNSSLSSDESVGTSNYKDNMSGCRSTITDISNFKRKLKRSNMFKDCTDYFKHNSMHNGTEGPVNWNTTQTSMGSHRGMPAGSNMSSFNNIPKPANFDHMQGKLGPVMSQKDRFNSRHLLLSQRFNRSIIPTSIPEHAERERWTEIDSQNGLLAMNKNAGENIEADSDEDNMFSNFTIQKETNNVNRKRSIDSEDISLPNQKRFKTLPPCKNSVEARKLQACNDKGNDFVFAKPMCPAKKPVKEKLISKCITPLTDTIPEAPIMPEIQHPRQEKSVEVDTEPIDEQSNSIINSTNLSMRPSFIKRKLFSQKLDVSEKRNLSMENINSPQNSMYGAIQQKKHKARKLQQATTQSCLNRDIQQNQNNLLDLIQKIVPIDQMNVTNQTNKTGSQSKNMTEEDDDKWDVISTISTRKVDDDVSDTYTDEEILNSTVKELQKDVPKEHTTKRKDKVKKSSPKKPSPVKPKNFSIILEKLPTMLVGSNQSRIKPFWETDFESDAEMQPSPRTEKLSSKENWRPDITRPKEVPKTQELSNTFSFKKPVVALTTSQNYTFDTTQKFNSTLRIRSHRAPKRDKIDQVTDEDAKSIVMNTENKQKKNQVSSSTKISIPVSEAITKPDSEKPKATANKKDKKSPKGKKQESKIDKQNQSSQESKNKHDNAKTADQTNKKESNIKKSQQKVNKNSKEHKIVENNAQPKKQSNTSKKLVEPKESNNKNHKTKKTTQRNNSPVKEDNNNNSNRAVRSCRKNSKNPTPDKSNLALNDTMNRTLRSRKLDLSATPKKKNTKARLKNTENYMISRLSDVSFSLVAEKNTLAKTAVTKMIKSRLLNADESDISFSLTPTPRKTRASSRNNTINTTPLRKMLPLNKELPISNIKPNRNRLPNKRYVY